MDDIDDLLSEVLERPPEQWPLAIEDLCARHADRADELRRRFAVLQRMGLASAAAPTVEAGAEFPERFGPYRLERRLGGGGMGVVYAARHEDLDRAVALKLVRPERLWFDDARARFQREIEAVARLEHQGCVQIHQVGESEGVPYFAMELIHGLSLQQVIERLGGRSAAELTGQDLAALLHDATAQPVAEHELFRGPWPRVCLRLALATADALRHAHGKGVIHRDLKPSNLMLTPAGRVVVIDFGLAVADGVDRMTRSGAVLGSLPYMAPEQVTGDRSRIDARTDVYALGVCLYELLTLTSPFESESSDATRARILTGSVAPLQALNPEADTDVAVVCARAMELEPARRYQSAAEFAADLTAALEHRAIRARPISTWLRLRRWTRREPWQAVALVVLVVGLTATSIGFASAATRAAENARLAKGERQARLQLADTLRDFDLLTGVPMLERAIAAEGAAHPAWPSQLATLHAWQRDHLAPLTALRPRLQEGLTALRARTRERTADERAADRRAHPQWTALQAAQRELAWLRALQTRLGAPKPPAALPPHAAELASERLNNLAWQRVAPDGGQRLRDDQADLGLAYAQAAVRAGGDSPSPDHLDTLAWAWLANGHTAAARAAADRALRAAPATRTAEFTRGRDRLHAMLDDLTQQIAAQEQRGRELDAEVDGAAPPRLREPGQQFLHDTLVELDARLARELPELAGRVERRIHWAERVGALTRAHPGARVTWADARRAIAQADDVVASARYRGAAIPLDDEVVIGLVPLGMNPVTKLWEFYDLRSAWDGQRDPATLPIPTHAADGTIAMTEDTGLVFVLLPGGECRIGCQAQDPDAPNYDPHSLDFLGPVQSVALWPFLIARHELTIAQWARLASGSDAERFPNGYPLGFSMREGHVIGPSNPVERISWHTAAGLLGEHGWSLPTEAQWEYACRAGTTTPWWCGGDTAALFGVANVYDQNAVRDQEQADVHEAFDDGHALHAPVGSLRASGFGLHDMHGNVAEWCWDSPEVNRAGFRDGHGERPTTQRPGDKSARGGSFQRPGSGCRSSIWAFMPADARVIDLGVRPVRRLRRE